MTGAAAARESLHLVVVARLDDPKLASKLQPLRALAEVAAIDLVRRTPLPMEGVRSHCPPGWLRSVPLLCELWRIVTLLVLCVRLPRERTFLIAFFLVPHAFYIELGRRLLGLRTIPVTLSQMDVDLALRRPRVLALLRAAHRVGVRGAQSARRLVEAGLPASRVFAPPNVFDPAPYQPALGRPEDLDVVFVGGLEPVKRLDILLDALAQVREQRPRLRAAIVGGGGQAVLLARRAARLGLGESVVFTGPQSPAEVAGWLRRARLFVMTSEVEGLPMAMIEALSCGVPVVIRDVGDVTTVARHDDNAWIVSALSPAAFAEAILALLEDEPRRLRLAAGARRTRERFATEYSLAAATAAWRAALVGEPH